jgi:hypothetical protein
MSTFLWKTRKNILRSVTESPNLLSTPLNEIYELVGWHHPGVYPSIGQQQGRCAGNSKSFSDFYVRIDILYVTRSMRGISLRA